ncbi:MAG: 30S ribosome-binding factor RbfA [Candidatus Margulisiibacteriota bacterium]
MSRQERVAELIQQEVSDILHTRVFDPRIGFVSITGVEMSADLKNASIFVSILGEEGKKREAMEGLKSATGFIQRELGRMLQLKTTPKIRFVRDDSLERGSRVLDILTKIKHEKDLAKDKRRIKKR